jgi:hypothetical protein
MMFDPQYHSKPPAVKGGEWDDGEVGVEEVIALHECSQYCKHLKLPDIIPTRPKPKHLTRKDLDRPVSQETVISISDKSATCEYFITLLPKDIQ